MEVLVLQQMYVGRVASVCGVVLCVLGRLGYIPSILPAEIPARILMHICLGNHRLSIFVRHHLLGVVASILDVVLTVTYVNLEVLDNLQIFIQIILLNF